MAKKKQTPADESDPIVVTDAAGEEHVWVDDGSEVPNPDQVEDAGSLLHRDNATTPGHLNGGNNG